MRIEAGKYYEDASGEKRGPAALEPEGRWWMLGDFSYYASGRRMAGVPSTDLVREWPTETQQEGTVSLDLHDVIIPTAARSIYLSGPMKGYPQSNYPLFNAVAEQLRRAGHRVYNPAEFGVDIPFAGFPIREAFAAYSKFICEEADAIVLLPGWEASKGANAEHALAENCGIEIIPFDRLSTTITTEGAF